MIDSQPGTTLANGQTFGAVAPNNPNAPTVNPTPTPVTVTGTSTLTGVATIANANVAILSGTANTAIYAYIASIEASALAYSIALG